MKHVYGGPVNFIAGCTVHFYINGPSNVIEIVLVIGMQDVTSRASLRFTQDLYFMVGNCSLNCASLICAICFSLSTDRRNLLSSSDWILLMYDGEAKQNGTYVNDASALR